MRKKKKYFLIPIIVVLSLVVIYFGSEALAIYRLGLKRVCIAKMSLPQRTEIVEEYLDYIYVPKAYISEETYLTKEGVIGKYVKLDAYIPKGSLFYKDALEDKEHMKDGLHLELENEEVTYDLFVKDIKVNPAHLLKGMSVDLYLTVNRKEVVSDLILSGARIIGLYDVNNREIKNNNDSQTLGTISIAIKKEMVPYLNKAIAIGEVILLVGSNLYDKPNIYLNTTSSIFDLLS